MKVSQFEELDEARCELLHPITGKPLGAAVRLCGPNSAKRKAIIADRARRIRRQVEKTGKLRLDDPEVEFDNNVAMLAACTLGWEGIDDDDGQPLPFSVGAAEQLYHGADWLRQQVQAAFDDKELFIKDLSHA